MTASSAAAPPALPEADRAYAARLARGYAALATLTTGLIVLGALVRAHGAGLACPDWPLCFGEVVPTFDLEVAFEWGHRAVAGLVSLGFATLAVLALRRPLTRRAAGAWIAAGAVLLGVQILLGALTVWELLASWTVTSHLLCGNAVNATLVLVWRRLRDTSRPGRSREPVPRWLRAVVALAAALLVAQIALGGLVSSKFAGLACDEWPTCAGGEWVPGFAGARGFHLAHRFVAYGLVALLGVAAVAGRGAPRLGPLLVLAASLGVLQTGVGVANVLLRIPVEVTGLHSFLAACLVVTLALCVHEAWARTRRERAAAAAA